MRFILALHKNSFVLLSYDALYCFTNGKTTGLLNGDDIYLIRIGTKWHVILTFDLRLFKIFSNINFFMSFEFRVMSFCNAFHILVFHLGMRSFFCMALVTQTGWYNINCQSRAKKNCCWLYGFLKVCSCVWWWVWHELSRMNL